MRAQGSSECYLIWIIFAEKDSSHAIVAFNTVDRGMLYIEPQSDNIRKPKIGSVFYDRDVYKKPSWDDTVTEIVLIP